MPIILRPRRFAAPVTRKESSLTASKSSKPKASSKSLPESSHKSLSEASPKALSEALLKAGSKKSKADPKAVRKTSPKAATGKPNSSSEASSSAASSKVLASKAAAKRAAPRAAQTATPKSILPRIRKAAAAKASPASKTLAVILTRLDDMKAEATVTIDLRGRSAFSDYMVVTSGRSNRHVGAVAESVAKGLKETGVKGLHIEGLVNSDWVLIDSGEVVVHIFRPEVREFYNLERLWSQSPEAIAKPA